jgi:PadR family transcriptional regulator PadR
MDVENWKVQLRKGILDMVILNILKPGPLYGLEMVQRLNAIPELTITEGTIYPLLSRLRSEGLVFTEWVESEQGRQRKYYSLSVKGKEIVSKLNDAWVQFSKSIYSIVEEKGGVS